MQRSLACCRPLGSYFDTRAGAGDKRARARHIYKHSSPEAAFVTTAWGGGTTALILCTFGGSLVRLNIVLSVVP